jgi:hypothetical protein
MAFVLSDQLLAIAKAIGFDIEAFSTRAEEIATQYPDLNPPKDKLLELIRQVWSEKNTAAFWNLVADEALTALKTGRSEYTHDPIDLA